jgi:hypothetical protein
MHVSLSPATAASSPPLENAGDTPVMGLSCGRVVSQIGSCDDGPVPVVLRAVLALPPKGDDRDTDASSECRNVFEQLGGGVLIKTDPVDAVR